MQNTDNETLNTMKILKKTDLQNLEYTNIFFKENNYS